jgi:hypothetical protein
MIMNTVISKKSGVAARIRKLTTVGAVIDYITEKAR